MSIYLKKLASLLLAAALTLAVPACAANTNEPPSEGPTEPTKPTGPAEPVGSPDPSPDTGKEPGQNDLLVSALERAITDLTAMTTPADALPGEFTASGTLVYVDDDGAAQAERDVSILRGAEYLALSAPGLLGEAVYLETSDLETFLDLTTPFLRSLELTPSPDGQGLSATVTGGELLSYLRLLLEANPAIPVLYAIVSGDGRAMDSSALEALLSPDTQVELSFNVSNDILDRVTVTVPTASGPVNAVFTDEGSDLHVEMTGIGTLSLTLGEDISLEGFLEYGDGTTVSLRWTAGGEFSYIHYSADVTGLAIEGRFDTAADPMTFTGYAATGNRGDRTDVALTITPGADLPQGSTSLSSLSPEKLAEVWEKLNSIRDIGPLTSGQTGGALE